MRPLFLLVPTLLIAQGPLFKLTRVSDQPILSPQGNGFESAGVFNPAVTRAGGRYVMLYRAQDRQGVSRIGFASSKDGVHFTRNPQPVLSPEAAYERGGGVEDPRIVRIGNIYYLTYTGYNKKDAQLCIATSRDLAHWDRKGVIMPAYQGRWNVGWTKSGAILNRKINGKYWMYFMGDAKGRPGQMGVVYSEDLAHWTEPLDHPVVATRPGMFDSKVAEPGPPPVLTKDGILLIYNGADDSLVYRTGWVLFEAGDPTRVKARSNQPILEPVRQWEFAGQVPNVVFVEGLVRDGAIWRLYYGAADKYVGAAIMQAP
jgi:predicted GH43/DUF377 family glycosyl hydrolase